MGWVFPQIGTPAQPTASVSQTGVVRFLTTVLLKSSRWPFWMPLSASRWAVIGILGLLPMASSKGCEGSGVAGGTSPDVREGSLARRLPHQPDQCRRSAAANHGAWHLIRSGFGSFLSSKRLALPRLL